MNGVNHNANRNGIPQTNSLVIPPGLMTGSLISSPSFKAEHKLLMRNVQYG